VITAQRNQRKVENWLAVGVTGGRWTRGKKQTAYAFRTRTCTCEGKPGPTVQARMAERQNNIQGFGGGVDRLETRVREEGLRAGALLQQDEHANVCGKRAGDASPERPGQARAVVRTGQ
jgi:hypothetical protein